MNYTPEINILMIRRQYLEQWSFEDLAAPYWRLYWNNRMGWSVWLNGVETLLHPGVVILIPPETHFTASSTRQATQSYIHFNVTHPYNTCRPNIYTFKASTAFKSFFRNWDGTLSLSQSLRVHSFIFEALSQVPESDLNNPDLPEEIQQIQQTMTRDMSARCNNDELAEQLAMNTNAFIRRFKHATGQSPKAWLIDQRIAEACRLLHHTDLSIDQIAMDTGFYDRYHFSRVFKQRREISPAAFRSIHG